MVLRVLEDPRVRRPPCHGHRVGHPRGRCPLTCRHRQWMEAYYDARAAAEAAREAVTGHWAGDLARYATEGPAMPTLRAWMVHR